MRRIVTEDKGYVPDCEFSQRAFKARLGITERNWVRNVQVRGDHITIDLGRSKDQRVTYETDQREFKENLGITDGRPILLVRASVWDRKVQISLAAA